MSYYNDDQPDELTAKLEAAEAKIAELEQEKQKLAARAALAPTSEPPNPYADCQNEAEVLALARERGSLIQADLDLAATGD